MANDYFQFKQFTVHQQQCAMKVGTDGVLLGALCQLPALEEGGAARILDVGTGTGLIALMAAQRFPNARIDAIDIDGQAVEQARVNIGESPFAERINARCCDYKDVADGCYDLIVSNPPFFTEDTSCPDARRDAARREASLPFETLIARSAALLGNDGRLCVIIPYMPASDFIMQCAMHRLYLLRRIDVKTTPRKEAKRVVLEFGRQSQPSVRHTLLLRGADGSASEEYRELTRDFYLESALR